MTTAYTLLHCINLNSLCRIKTKNNTNTRMCIHDQLHKQTHNHTHNTEPHNHQPHTHIHPPPPTCPPPTPHPIFLQNLKAPMNTVTLWTVVATRGRSETSATPRDATNDERSCMFFNISECNHSTCGTVTACEMAMHTSAAQN